MDREKMINSLAVAMGIKPVGTNTKEISRKYNTSTGTIYCNGTPEELEESEDEDHYLSDRVSVFPSKRLAM